MVNPYVMKKWGALIFSSLITVVCFFVGVTFYNLIVGMICMIAGMLTGMLTANLLLKNPFSAMLEGKGVMFFHLSSTGMIKSDILWLDQPYVRAKNGKKPIEDIWDRKAVNTLVPAQTVKDKKQSKCTIDANGNMEVFVTRDDFNSAKMAFHQYPCLIWNDQIGSFVTKEWLSDKENTTFAEHSILYYNQKMRELHASLRDFGRYVVELTKPKENWLQNKWIWLILLIFGGVIVILFLPSIINVIGGSGNTVFSALGGAANNAGSAITPR